MSGGLFLQNGSRVKNKIENFDFDKTIRELPKNNSKCKNKANGDTGKSKTLVATPVKLEFAERRLPPESRIGK
jgi:hypothetical protein